MAIALADKFQPYTDELFQTESKLPLLTNQDFDWTGAHTVKIYKISTSQMNDYGRSGPAEGNWSRYGAVEALSATTQEMALSRDRSFTFAIDRLDGDETAQQLQAASALARQLREVCVPELDSYCYAALTTGAGHKPDALALTADNIYGEILKASQALDDAQAPETNRVLVVCPAVYALLKASKEVVLECDVGQEQRLRGVIGMLDGAAVVKAPSVRLPKQFGFLLAHPSACVAPVKLEDYNIHENPPGISGSLVEGRLVYDAFVLGNKKTALYYQALPAPSKG